MAAKSIYEQLSPAQRRKVKRLYAELAVVGAAALVLFSVEAKHWSLQLLLCALLLWQVAALIRLLNATTINPKMRSPGDGSERTKGE